jgi:hypothetical protein
MIRVSDRAFVTPGLRGIPSPALWFNLALPTQNCTATKKSKAFSSVIISFL